MRSYKLEDKNQDSEFLSGKKVVCRAVMPIEEKSDLLRAGENLLVILSSGKKYKGKVIEFKSVEIDRYIMGELVIQRA